jgi:hypothetical protein
MLVIRQPFFRVLLSLRLQILLGFSLLLMQLRNEMTVHAICLLEVDFDTSLVSPRKLIAPLEISSENKKYSLGHKNCRTVSLYA